MVETLGNTNITVIQEAISYLEDFDINIIEIALRKTAVANGKWNYTKTILNNWLKKGIKTVEQIEANDIEFKSKTSTSNLTQEEKRAQMRKALEKVEEESKNGY